MSKTKHWRLVAASIAALVMVTGCSDDSDSLSGPVVKDAIGCAITQVDRSTIAPESPGAGKAPAKVVTKDLTKGQAKACKIDAESYLTLDLVGVKLSDGTVFTSTWADKRPVTARTGQGQLLAGLEKGLQGMRVGGRREITIPAAQAYGKDGNAGQGIGKDEALMFVVDLVGVTDSPLYCNEATAIPAGKEGKPTEVEMPIAVPLKLEPLDLKVGAGAEATKGKFVTLHYLGVSCATGQQFDSSWDSGEPLTMTIGGGNAIEGFDKGVTGMKVGGIRQIDIPADQAYGASGGPTGPNDPLTFVVELLAVADKAPEPTTTTAPAGGATTTTDPAGGATTTTAAG